MSLLLNSLFISHKRQPTKAIEESSKELLKMSVVFKKCLQSYCTEREVNVSLNVLLVLCGGYTQELRAQIQNTTKGEHFF